MVIRCRVVAKSVLSYHHLNHSPSNTQPTTHHHTCWRSTSCVYGWGWLLVSPHMFHTRHPFPCPRNSQNTKYVYKKTQRTPHSHALPFFSHNTKHKKTQQTKQEHTKKTPSPPSLSFFSAPTTTLCRSVYSYKHFMLNFLWEKSFLYGPRKLSNTADWNHQWFMVEDCRLVCTVPEYTVLKW